MQEFDALKEMYAVEVPATLGVNAWKPETWGVLRERWKAQ